jgi:hypothetical protein
MGHAETGVISMDVQLSFPARNCWREDDVPAFRERLTTLIHGATTR